ncbi:hypothetical protein C8R45DRAFT_1023197 [Mycena sanguinolenta]|nr:hypothetical protein C8R45DRAFT_1023197 [Mycena sanguinolenta]
MPFIQSLPPSAEVAELLPLIGTMDPECIFVFPVTDTPGRMLASLKVGFRAFLAHLAVGFTHRAHFPVQPRISPDSRITGGVPTWRLHCPQGDPWSIGPDMDRDENLHLWAWLKCRKGSTCATCFGHSPGIPGRSLAMHSQNGGNPPGYGRPSLFMGNSGCSVGIHL